MTAATVVAEMAMAEHKAWEALARYKFLMFGYWAAIWVHLNRINGQRCPNPWRDLVGLARERARKPESQLATTTEKPT